MHHFHQPLIKHLFVRSKTVCFGDDKPSAWGRIGETEGWLAMAHFSHSPATVLKSIRETYNSFRANRQSIDTPVGRDESENCQQKRNFPFENHVFSFQRTFTGCCFGHSTRWVNSVGTAPSKRLSIKNSTECWHRLSRKPSPYAENAPSFPLETFQQFSSRRPMNPENGFSFHLFSVVRPQTGIEIDRNPFTKRLLESHQRWRRFAGKS